MERQSSEGMRGPHESAHSHKHSLSTPEAGLQENKEKPVTSLRGESFTHANMAKTIHLMEEVPCAARIACILWDRQGIGAIHG